jgi:multiple sugar transport system substrate-binding protein
VKKKVVLFLIVAMLVFSGISMAAKVSLTFLTGPDTQGFFAKAIELFEKANPDITVNLIQGPHSTNARQQMFMTASMAHTSPYDLVWADIIWIPPLAANGWLLPIDKYVDVKKLYAQNFKATVDGSIWKGHIYRMPVMSDAGLIYYRKDLLEKAGMKPPKTFKELFEEAQKLQDPSKGLWGFVYEGAQYEGLDCFYLEWLWGNGGYYYDPVTRKVGIDSPEAIQATQYLVDTIHKYKITPPDVLTFMEEEARHMFEAGHAVFLRNWPYVWVLSQNDKDSKVKGKVGVTTEVCAEGEHPFATQGGWGISISSFIDKSKIPAAIKFAEFMNSYEIEKLMVKMQGNDVSRRDIYYDPDVLKWNPFFKDLRTILEHTRWRPASPLWPKLSDIMSRYLTMAMTQQMTPKQANEAMAKAARKAVQEYWATH